VTSVTAAALPDPAATAPGVAVREGMQPAGRLWTIDALRGAAALGVVLFHASDVPGISRTHIAERALDSVLTWGRYGVWLFFVISGFCIHRQWALRARDGRREPPGFLAFWRRRIRRLYPPYLVALAIYTALRHFADGLAFTPRFAGDIGLHLVLLQNLDPHSLNAINEVFWTLAIEEQLYLLYFVFLRVRIRFGWTAALLLGASARVFWFALALLVHRVWGSDFIVVTQSAAAQWYVWILGALSVEAIIGLVGLPPLLYRGGFAAAMLCGAAGLAYVYAHLMGPGFVRHVVWLMTDPLWGTGCFVLVNAIARLESRGPSSTGALLARIGLFSYSLYLSHELVTAFGWRWIGPRVVGAAGPISSLLVTPALTIASVGLACAFFQLFERPFCSSSQRLRAVHVRS
jgi:peptidoglycan/LPS O-acetylase OafA/YrhL